MSNAQAIAAVTATLQNLLLRGLDIPDVTVKPLDIARKKSSNQINLYLYHTSINAAWRNQVMPNGAERGQPPLALCLHYLITAYGEGDDETKAHQLLGKAMGVFHDHPLLGADEIKNATQTDLPDSNLHEQVERVRITCQSLSLEEISKLWAAFQTHYRISAAYEVSVVLVESTRPAREPLPVLSLGEHDHGPLVLSGITPPFPTIERIHVPNGRVIAQLGDQVTLIGHHFTLETGNPNQVTIEVQFMTTRLHQPISVLAPAGQRTDTQIPLNIPHQVDVFYPAGLYRVLANVMPANQPAQIRTTNELPLMLAPRIVQLNGNPLPLPPASPVSIARTHLVNDLGDVTLNIQCSPDVLPEQSAALLVGAQMVNAEAHTAQTNFLAFKVKQVPAGTYRLRLRVDGIDSPLIDFSDPVHPKFDETQRVTIT